MCAEQKKVNTINKQTTTIMKKLLVILFACISANAYSQGVLPIEISYDDAGNRIMRKVMPVSMMASGGDNHNDSTYYIDRMESIQMKVYPNPTQGIVHIELQSTTDITDNGIRVFDSKGRIICEKSGDGNTMEIDLKHYPSGYYIVDLYANKERTTWKIVKE